MVDSDVGDIVDVLLVGLAFGPVFPRPFPFFLQQFAFTRLEATSGFLLLSELFQDGVLSMFFPFEIRPLFTLEIFFFSVTAFLQVEEYRRISHLRLLLRLEYRLFGELRLLCLLS